MKVVVAGYGLEGKESLKYWKSLGHEVTIADEVDSIETPDGAKAILGKDAFSRLGDYDLVVRSPSINPDRLPYGDRLWSATAEFFEKCPAPIIGVTGTKGKGTTCSVITEILRAAGKTVHLLGNIGTPSLGELSRIKPTDFVVYELSSFQLWELTNSPETAVVLLIEPDHLDVHNDYEDYLRAKGNIAKYQKLEDVVVYHPSNPASARVASASPGKKVRYGTESTAHIYDGCVWYGDVKICPVDEVALPGAHNLENICAAITAVWRYVNDVAAIKSALKSFAGLPHHIEKVREVKGVTYYDDSFSSAPAAATAAIRSFNVPTVVILGGYDKGADFGHLVDALNEHTSIRALLIGDCAPRISKACDNGGFKNYTMAVTRDFRAIINKATEMAGGKGVVLLSPGCASFDMFKNFYERGDIFQEIVNSL
ncbi:UDP-N-acetylmuramoyl-L-alanine--D-glutamate ligase [Candidatus Nomurabacteria bacterium]|nr:UDP-N-acetylmuramoyl-L-alanine--D-glutamate ligase [Candidatus Nomurabacteria bacterium]